MATSLEVANTILSQLGGNRFCAMTGASNLVAGDSFLQFKIPARMAKEGINRVKITLDPSDTYTVEFYKIGRAPKFQVNKVCQYSDVYNHGLADLFTSVTGLYTRF